MCCGKNRAAAARPRTVGAAGTTPPGAVAGATQTFSLIIEGQEPQGFGSRLEADAENARQGYVGIVRQMRVPR